MVIQSRVVKSRLLASVLLFLGSGGSVCLLSNPASAAACRDIDSVQRSADVAHNEEMGGHVTQHILGYKPPPGSSQQGKTMFSDKGKYDNAWGFYTRAVTNPKNCSGNSYVLQTFHLGYKIDAFSCREADGEGKCTKWDSFYAEDVSVGFVRQTNGTWILNTAYPLPAP
jgi:hypothetical protein